VSDRADTLLAAFAHDPDALTADERREVEALLAIDDDARAQAVAVRELIGAVRDLPQPTAPSWDALARSIGAAVDRSAATPPSRWERMRGWLLRPAIGVGFAAATAAAIGLWIAKRPASEPTAVLDVPSIDAGAPVIAAPKPLFHDDLATAGELADLDQLDDAALDRLAASLDDDPIDDHDGFGSIGGGADHRDDDIALVDDAELDADDDALGNPDLDWVDELSDDDVDTLDQWLATHRSPT
jgi:hypothetical protein